MTPEAIAKLVGRSRLFQCLSDAELRLLADRFVERRLRAGQLIFYQGDPADSFYLVGDGRIRVFVASEAGEVMVLATLTEGDTFGEIALIDGGTRSASAESLGPSTLLSLSRSVFLDLVHENPRLTDALLESLGGFVRRVTEHSADLVFLDLPGRLAKYLLQLVQDAGGADDPVELELELTQTELAAVVGGSRQSVNQILHSFERRGYLEIHGRHLHVKRPDMLRRAVN
jgi:CRP/FNR family cyclic AMP-dependent transcriptional regulator